MHDCFYTALIVDDEAPMRDHLRRRLAQVWPQLNIVADANNAINALQMSEKFKPQIIFLDIRMPGKTGLEIANLLSSRALIVFVTAYDEYAVSAFEEGAIDYILKPIDQERLHRTCSRIQERLRLNQPITELQNSIQIEQLLIQLVEQQKNKEKKYLRWIQASVGNGLRLISTEEILFFRADEKYTSVQTHHNEFLIRKSLKDLEQELDPNEFCRIHRSILVKFSAITSVQKDERGRQLINIRDFHEKLEVSRNHNHLFQTM